MTTMKSRIIQYIAIILITAAAGGGYWYWKNAHAAGTVSTNRPSFEAPLTTDLNLTAGQGIATYSRVDGAGPPRDYDRLRGTDHPGETE